MFNLVLFLFFSVIIFCSNSLYASQSKPEQPTGVSMMSTNLPSTFQLSKLQRYAEFPLLTYTFDFNKFDSAHSLYKQSIMEIESKHLESLWDLAIKANERNEYHLRNSETVKSFLEANENISKLMFDAEDKFWTTLSISEGTTEEGYEAIQQLRRIRDRELYSEAFVFNIVPETATNIVELFTNSPFSELLTESVGLQQLLRDYEFTYHLLIKKVYKQERKILKEFAVREANGVSLELLDDRARARTHMCRRMNRIVKLNDQTVEACKEFMDDSVWEKFYATWTRTIYPEIFPNPWDIELVMLEIIDGEHITKHQKIIIELIFDEYQLEEQAISSKMSKQVQEWHLEKCLLKPFKPDKFDDMRLELVQCDLERELLSRRVIEQVYGELTDAQLIAFDTLRQGWDESVVNVDSGKLGTLFP